MEVDPAAWAGLVVAWAGLVGAGRVAGIHFARGNHGNRLQFVGFVVYRRQFD